MIKCENGVFWLDTRSCSYIFRLTAFGHPEHIYYGERLNPQPVEALAVKRSSGIGSTVIYDASDEFYCLDNLALEWSGIGSGDYRFSPAEIKMPDGSFSCDMVYVSHEIIKGGAPLEALPSASGGSETLALHLRDKSNNVDLTLFYTVFDETDMIARRCVLKNNGSALLVIRKLMSMMLDMPDKGYRLITLDGGWIKEAHRHDRPLAPGIYINSSTTGASSNRHNPGFLLAARGADEDTGEVYGFNLVYSGNHFGCVELSNHGLVRVASGINPHCFEWELKQGEAFETPQAVMSFSNKGFNGLSSHFHDFVNASVIPPQWRGSERPVLYNSWEACFFDFTSGKLLSFAKRAKALGVELFVLDDGWFGQRDSDKAGLGDYSINKKKLPYGLKHLASKINGMGMRFGLWFEPEMINEDSDLYREHPGWAVKTPGKTPALGRNQLVLDLCNKEVRDYIVENVCGILDNADISYVKWDMNRHISDAYSACIENQGEFYHRYILGLYDILSRIFRPRPHILLETCASGGNRFDLGMLCFSPQIWASDCTDPVERLKIQGGLSYLYPQSTFGAHVSDAPHQQTLRETPLSTRFNVACFGSLGYELNLAFLSKAERAEIKEQIEFYKAHRKTFLYGRFRRIQTNRGNAVQWQVSEKDGSRALVGRFQTLAAASPPQDYLRIPGLDKNKSYTVSTKPQRLFIKRFGGLIHHVMPVKLNPGGFILNILNRLHAIYDCVESYEGDGLLLSQGIQLNNQFMGSYYNKNTRLLGDFGSSLYVVNEK